MATDQANPPEGFTKAEAPDQTDDYDTDWSERPVLSALIQGVSLARRISTLRQSEPFPANLSDCAVGSSQP